MDKLRMNAIYNNAYGKKNLMIFFWPTGHSSGATGPPVNMKKSGNLPGECGMVGNGSDVFVIFLIWADR